MILENSSGESIRFYSVRNHIFHSFSPHCNAKGGFLVCNISTIAMQRRLNCIAKGLILLCKRSPFAIAKLAQSSAHQPNLLYTNNITLHAKLTNFEQKISLCVQLAVLSDEKCKYCLLSRCIMRYSQMYGAKKLQVEL